LTNAPSFGDALGAALRDTWPALRSWLGWLIAIVVGCCGGFFVVILALSPPTDSTVTNDSWQIGIGAVIGAGIFAALFFAKASAVRTVHPEFRMTIGRFFGVLGYTLLAGVVVVVGFICLVVPGIFLSVKLTLSPYFYTLDEPEPLRASWALTRDRFWLTSAVLFAVPIIAQIFSYGGGMVMALAAAAAPIAGLIALPFLFLLLIAGIQFSENAYIRWAYALKTSSTLSNTGTALPPTVTP
jgi:hypothetical protein